MFKEAGISYYLSQFIVYDKLQIMCKIDKDCRYGPSTFLFVSKCKNIVFISQIKKTTLHLLSLFGSIILPLDLDLPKPVSEYSLHV